MVISIEQADRGLDEAGRLELAHIVALSDSNRLGALQQIGNLARRYPDSPHVLLSKALLEVDSLLRHSRGSVSALIARLQRIVDLDPGYAPSQHWLCTAQLASCCRWEILDREGREEFVELHLPILMSALAERRFDVLADHVLTNAHDVLIDAWRARGNDAISAYYSAMSHIDSRRYEPGQLEPFQRTARVLFTGTDVIRARSIAVRWLEIWLPRVQEGFAPEAWPERYA